MNNTSRVVVLIIQGIACNINDVYILVKLIGHCMIMLRNDGASITKDNVFEVFVSVFSCSFLHGAKPSDVNSTLTYMDSRILPHNPKPSLPLRGILSSNSERFACVVSRALINDECILDENPIECVMGPYNLLDKHKLPNEAPLETIWEDLKLSMFR